MPIIKWHKQLKLDELTLGARLILLKTTVIGLVRDNKIDCIAVEVPISYPGRVAGTAARGQGYGAVQMAGHSANVRVLDIRPNEAKKALTGKGNANKALMIEFAEDLVGITCAEDEADAIGIALAGWRKLRDEELSKPHG